MSERGILAYDSRRGSASKVCGLPGAAIVVLYFLGFAATEAASQQILRNTFTGSASCLDIINDGQNNRLHMAPCGNFTGQQWDIISESGNSRLKTRFTGPSRCLDVINDGQNDKVQMASCGNFSGQLWSLTELHPPLPNINCAVCNDGSHQKGPQTLQQLCANHGGINPNLGCSAQF